MTSKLYMVGVMNPTNRSTLCESGAVKRAWQLNVWLAVTTVTYLVTLYLIRTNPEWSPVVKVLVTLAPVLPGLLYLRDGLRHLAALDELQRRIQMEAWLFAAIGTVVLGAIINVCNAHGLTWGKLPHGLETGGTYLAMFFLWCAGSSIANHRYR